MTTHIPIKSPRHFFCQNLCTSTLLVIESLNQKDKQKKAKNKPEIFSR